MSVIVHTNHPHNPVLVFAEADGYHLDDFPSNVLHVTNGDGKVSTFSRWDSVAIVDDATAAAFGQLGRQFPCARCDDRAARLREAVAVQAQKPDEAVAAHVKAHAEYAGRG